MKAQIRIAGVIEESIVDGKGIRFVIFTQGCFHHCFGCHNPHTHKLDGGYLISIEEIIDQILKNNLIDGVTFSGGEPLLQSKMVLKIINELKKQAPHLNYILYSGFTYEEIIEQASEENQFLELLKYLDYLIDGKFEIDKKDEKLAFKGSSNQRLINVRKSLSLNKVIEEVEDIYDL